MASKKTILVIGGTGHFGGRICRRILGEPNTRLVVTSRSLPNAKDFVDRLNKVNPGHDIEPAAIDQFAGNFEEELKRISPDIVIHTAGPYQGQGYRVATACISAGSHYLDLADGRDFVSRFSELDEQAKSANLLLVSGASTLPGLSSAVIDHFRANFSVVDEVRTSIAPAHQTPRGTSTIRAVLSYCGKPFEVLENGKWVKRYGWQDLKLQKYAALGTRISAACDVPDLALIPRYLPGAGTVTFHAALEAYWEQLALWGMAGVVRIGMVKNWERFVPIFNYISEKLVKLGSDTGGMHVSMSGVDNAGAPLTLSWRLTARNNHGPEIPCTPAVLLARKLVRDKLDIRGAMPCLGLFTLDDFSHEVGSLDICWDVL